MRPVTTSTIAPIIQPHFIGPSPGSRLGTYEILGPIGAGGMGEVYRARDTQLGRDVAIKVLPDAFAARSRAARALRARGAAARRRSTIRTSRRSTASRSASGVTRARARARRGRRRSRDRLARGPMPRRRGAARSRRRSPRRSRRRTSKGIVHRDLKPANIKITPDGHGQGARLRPGQGDRSRRRRRRLDADAARRRSRRRRPRPGVILGTAAYMSPEQARGKAGRQARRHLGVRLRAVRDADRPAAVRAGETLSDAIAAVLTREPDWSRLPPGTPALSWQAAPASLEKDPIAGFATSATPAWNWMKRISPRRRSREKSSHEPVGEPRRPGWSPRLH